MTPDSVILAIINGSKQNVIMGSNVVNDDDRLLTIIVHAMVSKLAIVKLMAIKDPNLLGID